MVKVKNEKNYQTFFLKSKDIKLSIKIGNWNYYLFFFITGHRFRFSVTRFQSSLQHLPTKSLLPCPRNHLRPSFLRGHRHVVFRLRGSRTLFGLAFISGFLGIRPNPVHFANARLTRRKHVEFGLQNDEIFLSRSRFFLPFLAIENARRARNGNENQV